MTERKSRPKSIPDHKQQVSVYLQRKNVDDGKDATMALMAHPDGPKSWSDFVDKAVAAHVKTLTEKYNDGQPFPERNRQPSSGARID